MTTKDLNKYAIELIEKVKNGEDSKTIVVEFENFIKEVSKLLGNSNPLVLKLHNQLNTYVKRIKAINTLQEEILRETNKMKEFRINAGLLSLISYSSSYILNEFYFLF